VSVDMIPTPEARSAYRSRTVSQRTWGWIATGVGAALTVGGVSYLIVNKGQHDDKEKAFQKQIARYQSGGDCDPSGVQANDCTVARQIALADLDDVTSRAKFGWIAGGVGVAALGLGVVVLLINDDPNRYEPKADSDVFGSLRLLPSVLPDGRGGALVFSGTMQ